MEDQSNNINNVQCLERLADNFESASRRWELVVYPSLFAFIVLAAYGFFLIYQLTGDIGRLAESVEKDMNVVAKTMKSVSQDVNVISVDMHGMSRDIGTMSMNISDNLDPMQVSMAEMNYSLQSIKLTTTNMGYDMQRMNRNISRPMSVMNSIMPW